MEKYLNPNKAKLKVQIPCHFSIDKKEKGRDKSPMMITFCLTHQFVSNETTQSKGVESVRARVLNLQEINPQINHDSLMNAIIQSFFDTYQSTCQVHRRVQTLPRIFR
jgi:hypothetical protein